MGGPLSPFVQSSLEPRSWVQIAHIRETDPVILLREATYAFKGLSSVRNSSHAHNTPESKRSVRRLESRIECKGYDTYRLNILWQWAIDTFFGLGGAVEKVSQARSGQAVQWGLLRHIYLLQH